MQDKKDDEIFKICPNCSKLIKWDAEICNYCGTKYSAPQFSQIRGGLLHPVSSDENTKTTIYKRPISIVLSVLFGVVFLITLIALIGLSSTPLFAIIIYFPIFIIITFSLIFVNLRKNKKRTLSFLISTLLLIAILIVSSVGISNMNIKNFVVEIKKNILANNVTSSFTATTTATVTYETTPATTLATIEQASATALLNLLSYSGVRSNGFIIIQGQVENISSNELNNVEAIVRYYDKDNNFIRYDVATIQYNPIMPGQTSPFKVIGIDDPLIAKYSVYFQFTNGGLIETINSQHKY